MKNVKSKIALASIVLCGSVALGISSLNAPVASAATLEGFEVKTASLRVPDGEYGAGIRFTLGMGNVTLAEGATTGVLMIPTSSLGASDLTVGLDNEDLRTYDNVEWKDMGDGTKEAYLHLYDVPPVQYSTSISLRAFVDHDADPATDPIYTEVAKASVAEVADWAYYNDADLDETEKASLQSTYLTGKVVYHSEGQVWDEKSAIYNQTIAAIEAPTKDGYSFKGWWNEAGTHEWDFATTKVTSMTTNLYAKWEKDIDPVVEARVGEDENTLIFFDRDFGVTQVRSATGSNFGYTTAKAYGKEAGSLRVTLPETNPHNTVDLDFKDYEFGDSDYVEFYVYNDTNVGTLTMRFGYGNATYLVNGEWTRVIGSASWLQANKYFRFYGQAGNYSSGTNVGGDIYISKVKAYSGFADLTADATSTWYIGDTAFTGKVSVFGAAPLDTSTSNTMQKALYQTGNAVTMTLWKHSYAGFQGAKLVTPIDATSEAKYISITAKGADANLFTIVVWDDNGTVKTGATKACLTRDAGNGFTTYIFRISGYKAGSFRITPMGDTSEAAFATTTGRQIIISDFKAGDYASLRTGEDANTLFFTDGSLGYTLKQLEVRSGENITSGSYSTEKAYGNEQGSFKAAGISHGSQAWLFYGLSDADKSFLADTDYISFYIYSTASTKYFISIGYEYGTAGVEIMSNAWTKVILPASVLKGQYATRPWFNIHPAGNSSDGGSFDLYFSKFVRYTAEEAVDLAGKGATDEWTLGSTTFVGAPVIHNGATNSGYEAGTEHKKAYFIDGELFITFVRTGDGDITMNLLNPIEVAANAEMYVTVTMYNYGRLEGLNGYMNSSGSYPLSYVAHTDIGGGYAKVVLKCKTITEAYTITKVRLDAENLTGASQVSQFRIRDIVVGTSY